MLAIVTRQHVRNLLKDMTPEGTAGAVGADDFGILGMGPVLRDLRGAVIS